MKAGSLKRIRFCFVQRNWGIMLLLKANDFLVSILHVYGKLGETNVSENPRSRLY